MPLNLSDNYFELFGLRPVFEVEAASLEKKYRELQRMLHPDRYASMGNRERQLAVRAAAHVNDAYRVLKDDCERAQYLLALAGAAVDDEQNTTADADFLVEQMELREAMDAAQNAADPVQALSSLSDKADAGCREMLAEFERMRQRDELQGAHEAVNKARFFNKIQQEIKTLIHRCERGGD